MSDFKKAIDDQLGRLVDRLVADGEEVFGHDEAKYGRIQKRLERVETLRRRLGQSTIITGAEPLRVRVEVSGGVAEVVSKPKGIEVEIYDWDDEEAEGEEHYESEIHDAEEEIVAGVSK